MPTSLSKTRSRKRKADENVDPSSTAAAAAAPAGSSKPAKKAKKAKAPAVDLYSVYLEREEEGEVEVYDSCDELRRKITAHLRAGGTTKAAFMRDIIRAASSDEYPIKAIQHKQLADFMALSGATGGCSSKVCYAAYVYFEKKRIAEGGEKSEHRLDMEDEWEGEGGLPRERRRESYLIPTGTVLCEDEVGRLVTVPDCCS
ncbi:hypothetical protein FIBSPDRAFT_740177 [Athelia psychrophila]|uniref:DUF7726 domain-containing protein n=1 Tax=Athelia psychrophila TaxID=1759441 RepID=A0A166DVA6_9AGAM|nr:hypothetical protein FIBSPDRAFT_750835 [Fibularhizoctonia sp. CBS 109695]KZP21777.1 hypothetical protein FIBSPDRAFT_740177 [Fibularhizoctonia sp. CBS 109695]